MTPSQHPPEPMSNSIHVTVQDSEVRVWGQWPPPPSTDPMAIDERARCIADEIVYRDQRAWSGLLFINRLKLRHIISEAIASEVHKALAAAGQEGTHG